MKRFFVLSIFITIAAFCLCACGTQSKPVQLTISCASSLKPAMTEIESAFEALHSDIDLVFTFGATTSLQQQIEQGAPIDVFCAADQKSVDALAASGDITADSVYDFAQGTLVLVPGSAYKGTLEEWEDLLNQDVKKIAIADPNIAPYGKAAKELLDTKGIWGQLVKGEKIVFATTVDDAYQYAKSGEVDAAAIAKSTAISGDLPFFEDAEWLNAYTPIIQSMGIVASTKYPDQAKLFEDFMKSDDAKNILKNYGFTIPTE